jgi:hypothetical protein
VPGQANQQWTIRAIIIISIVEKVSDFLTDSLEIYFSGVNRKGNI